MRSELQQEINSECPFCHGTDVGCFQIHHIDGNPANHSRRNLILLCPTCHSKIELNIITRQEVETTKLLLQNGGIGVECTSISSRRDLCCWEPYPNVRNAFYSGNSGKLPFPILSISCVNHSTRTIVLTGILIQAKRRSSGLSGLPKPQVLKPLCRYMLGLPPKGVTWLVPVDNSEIEVPPKRAFKFDIQLFEAINKEPYAPDGRIVLSLGLQFGEHFKKLLPTVYLNCTDENESIRMITIE